MGYFDSQTKKISTESHFRRMLVNTKQLAKARRNAMKAAKRAPCIACIAYGGRCSDFRPCKRCVKLSRACSPVAQLEMHSDAQAEKDRSSRQSAASAVERPLAYSPSICINENTLPIPALPMQVEWAGPQITKFSALGHDVSFLSDFFASLSIQECTVLVQAMDAAATVAGRNLQYCMTSASSMDQSRHSHIKDALPLCIEDTDNAAFICTCYDPSSRRRRAIVANSRRAAYFHMHCEEMLARAAMCELPPPFIEWDALLLCLHMSVAEHFKCSRVSELYQRMYLGGRGQRRAQLVSGRMEEVKDDLGRVIEVRWEGSAYLQREGV